jgi:hypothetical protein
MPIDPLDAPHIERLRPWLIKAWTAIDSQVENARAHAEKGMTRAVINADEGRSTWRQLNRQKSARAAQKRLDDLREHLVGIGKVSLGGLIQDARDKFHREAFEHWRAQPGFDKILDPDARPTANSIRMARGLIIHDKSPFEEIAPVFLSISQQLTSAMNAAAVQGLPERHQDAIFSTWENKAKDRLKQKAKEMLSDSQIRILGDVGRSMVREDMRKK